MAALVWDGTGWSGAGGEGSPPPVHRISFTGKADTAAGVVPSFDAGGVVPTAINNGAAGAALRVTSGHLTLAPTAAGIAAGYLTGDAGGPVTLMGCRWKVAARSTAGESLCLAMTTTKQPTYGTPFTNAGMHLVIGRTTWQVDYITGGGGATITNIKSGALPVPVVANDSTYHEVQALRLGSTVFVKLPGGTVIEVTDTNLSSKAGVGFWIEPFCSNGDTDGIPKIQSAWVGTGPQTTFWDGTV